MVGKAHDKQSYEFWSSSIEFTHSSLILNFTLGFHRKYDLVVVVIIIIIIIILTLVKTRVRKNSEIENAGKTTAPGGRPTQSRHVTKQN